MIAKVWRQEAPQQLRPDMIVVVSVGVGRRNVM